MGNLTYVFERVERKFLLTPSQYEGLMRVLPEYMQADQYGESTILSLYLIPLTACSSGAAWKSPYIKRSCVCAAMGCRATGTTCFWK